jgi:hypothetical protein
MNTKKLLIILIAIAFVFVTVFSVVGLFAIKKINVDYAVSVDTDVSKSQEILNGYVGKSLVLLNVDEINSSLLSDPYLEVVSVEKQFPNVLNVKIKERREIYEMIIDGKTFVATESGLLLFEGEPQKSSRTIEFTFGYKVELVGDVVPGGVIKTNSDDGLNKIFEMVKSVNLTDCIKGIELERALGSSPNFGGVEYNAVLSTYTGANIIIDNILEYGMEKITAVFDAYDNYMSDYQKTHGKIYSSYNAVDSEITVSHQVGEPIVGELIVRVKV